MVVRLKTYLTKLSILKYLLFTNHISIRMIGQENKSKKEIFLKIILICKKIMIEDIITNTSDLKISLLNIKNRPPE